MDVKELARQEKESRSLARTYLRHFVTYTFPGYNVRPHNQLVADVVDLAVLRILKRVMINIPPQYGKSEIVSRKAPAYALGRFPDLRILLISYAFSLASTLSRNARDLMNSSLYKNLFPDIKLSRKSQSVRLWEIEGHRGGVFAAGVTGGISGHPSDFTIIDDPVKDEEEALSETRREAIWNWYWASSDSRLSPDAVVILCMTRWHEDDLAGRLLLKQEEPDADKWYVLRLPAKAESSYEISEWCEKNFVAPDRYLNLEMVKRLRDDYESNVLRSTV
jgi:hypothetical protein